MEQTVICRVEKKLLDKYRELHPIETKRLSYTGIANIIIEKYLVDK